MSDRGSRDRQVMTLLVQLFGRDVMDRLATAGFETPATMAKAGAEKLASEAGIPIAIARRVSIVVEESPGPAPTPSSVRTDSATRAKPAEREKPVERANPVEHAKPVDRVNAVGRDESDMLLDADPLSEPTVREERRPTRPVARKRSEPRVAVEPVRPSAPAAPPPAVTRPADAPPSVAHPAEPAAAPATAGSGAHASPAAAASSALVSPAVAASPAAPSPASAPSAAPATRTSFPDEGDPFVDDVALVSWMGLSSHQPDGRLAFTVSDTILDPVEAAAPAPTEASPTKAARPERPRPADAALIETPARPSLISGSFWTFGRPADSTPASTGPKPETQPPAASPRRRKHDGH